MADVFISYSRKDDAFAQRLHRALTTQKRDVWIDWEDIPLTADWWQEICSGIRAADSFVFVMSPQSLSSPICHMELDYALTANKRIIPVIWEEPDESAALGALATVKLDNLAAERLGSRDLMAMARHNWQALARHNWLFFRQQDEFQATFDKLSAAIDTDFEYVHNHSRLLVRADEWTRRDHDESLLLTGADLRTTETWLEVSGDKQPKPTTLQMEFITASQQLERDTQRRELERQQQQLALERTARSSEQRARNRLRYLVAVLALALAIVGLVAFQLNQLLAFQDQVSVTVDKFYSQAKAYREGKRYGEAIAEYTRVIELNNLNFNPLYLGAYHGLGLAHFQLKEYPTAVNSYNQYLANRPDDTTARLDRAQALVMRRDFVRAEDDYVAASQISEEHEAVLADFRDLLGQPQPVTASYADFETLIDSFQFQRVLVKPDTLLRVGYYGNTPFAFENGRRWGYHRYAQGLHAGLDFFSVGQGGPAPAYAGVDGVLQRIDRQRGVVYVIVGDFVLMYTNLIDLHGFNPGDPITPDTVIGNIDPVNQHVHVEVRYPVQGPRWILNPLLFMSEDMRSELYAITDFADGFYTSRLWNAWQIPLEQPVIELGGEVIGPTA